MLAQPTFPWHLRALNRADRALRAIGVRPLPFRPDALLEAAARRARLDDFAEDAVFREGLEVLCRAAEEDARFTLVGRTIIRQFVIRALVNRLRTVEAQRREPEIAQTPLVPPLIVIGLPRSGTTILHHLLAQDEQARPLRFWELMEPLPGTGPGPDRRRDDLARLIGQVRRADTGLDAKHHFDADHPEECMLLLDGTLTSLSFWVFAPVYGYLTWLQRQDHRAPYRTYRWLLQAFQRAAPGRRLTLKAPAHTAALGALLEAVPEALVVETHRDPAEVVPSTHSLLHSLHAIVTDLVDVPRFAEANMIHLEHMIAGSEAGRAAAPRAVLDVAYDEIVGEPLACVRRIRAHFGLPDDARFADRARRLVAARPRDKYGRHQYAAEDFGSSPGAIRERFARYHARYQALRAAAAPAAAPPAP